MASARASRNPAYYGRFGFEPAKPLDIVYPPVDGPAFQIRRLTTYDRTWRGTIQRVDDYRRPTWPGDDHPEQLHVDLGFDDRPAAQRRAEDLGATLLPPPHGSAPVYADPADHPFCLGGQGE